MPVDVKVNALAINDSVIFAGTDGEGIFESTDNGEHWNSLNEGLQNKFIHTIFINGTTMFAGTEAGASVSTNNGVSWSSIDSGLSDKGVWSFAARQSTPGDSTIFAGIWSGVYKSTNNGTSWAATSLSATTMPVHSFLYASMIIIFSQQRSAAEFFIRKAMDFYGTILVLNITIMNW